MKSRYTQLSELATLTGCVLEKESKGYSLYSNLSFVGADCANLDEVADLLANDSAFNGKLEL
jgi:hypothetical protein